MNIPPGKKLPVIIQKSTNEDEFLIEKHLELIKHAGRIESIRKLHHKENEPTSSTAMHGEMKLLVPLADLIDIEDEIKRLSKKISSTIKEIEKSRLKLNNENFISNAPPEIVKQEKSRIQENEILISELNIQIDKLRK